MKNLLLALLFGIGLISVADAQNNPQMVVQPSAPTGALTLVAGNTAQPLWAANTVQHGAIINNPLSLSVEGIAAAEPIYVNLVGTAVVSSGGQSIEIQPGGTLIIPYGTTTAASWIATTISHKISVVVY